ncbi:hypothetical protein F5Y06DRAFT_7439 [Hypoxylon sp. FL0890]|nr:hypothetical protein F5Y06DRAFT_7439 [Hypoxylon sp. FL0890]
MRSSIYRRRTRANDLKVFVRDDVPDAASDDELSDSEDDGEPDSPSPTSPNFPSPSPTGSSTQQPGRISSSTTSTESSQSITSAPSTSASATPDTGVPASQSSSILITPSASSSATQTSSIDASVTQGVPPENNDPVGAQSSQVGGKPVMSRDGAIALGTVGGIVFIAALVFIIWKCRRRRSRTGGGPSSKFSPFSGFRRMEESPAPVTAHPGSAPKTQSKIMDDLMAAAYAAEDGNASQYGAYADEKRQPNASVYAPDPGQPAPMRHSNWPDPQAPTSTGGGTNSLYVNQLLTGFYKSPRTDGLAVPGNARMPPPAAPSVAGQTEVTATTESTWRTWGWSQEKKPKETWVDKCIRLGGLK